MMCTHCNFPNSTLANPSVGDNIPLLIRFEFLDGVDLSIIEILSFIHASVRARRNEANNVILGSHSPPFSVALGAVGPHRIVHLSFDHSSRLWVGQLVVAVRGVKRQIGTKSIHFGHFVGKV